MNLKRIFFKKLSKYFFKLVLSLINTLNPKIFEIIIEVKFDWKDKITAFEDQKFLINK